MGANASGYYVRVPVWSVALRLYHWTFALSCITLILTGLYINYPPISTWAEFMPSFSMATMRTWHFAAAFFFMSALAVRFYLYLFGNRYEKIQDCTPVSVRNIKSLFHAIMFYLYMLKEHEARPGHNVLAGTFYCFVVFISLLMIVSGLYLMYPETGWIQSMGNAIFGSQQMARFIHYAMTWFFIFFTMIHVYLCIWNDIFGSEGIISGIFSGRKMLPADAVAKDGTIETE